MRLLGISKNKINCILVIQNMLITLISVIISIVACRLLLLAVNEFTSGMGIVINYMKFYSEEFLIVALIIVVSLIPSFIANISPLIYN